jgi:hypothetical protein
VAVVAAVLAFVMPGVLAALRRVVLGLRRGGQRRASERQQPEKRGCDRENERSADRA